MKIPRLLLVSTISATLHLISTQPNAVAAEKPSAAMSGPELASRLDLSKEPGTTYVRMRMEVKPSGQVLQLQVKQRRSRNGTEMVYQILWPKERKGEAVLLRKREGQTASGAVFTPPNRIRTLGAGDMKEPFFGSDLSYEDVIDNFFSWQEQNIVAMEMENGAQCFVLESKPTKNDRSSYSLVRSWIDDRRFVPLRVEKFYSPGKPARRIDTTRVVNSGGRAIPANMRISGPGGGSVTDLDGSRIKHDVAFSDREFTPEGLGALTIPRGAPAE